MLIDATQPEETRVVVVNGNKLEDVEFETTHRRQIKGNIYLGKVMRVEPSLQACFVDYGGNKHGFMAFGEIHPDYYNLSADELSEVDNEVNEIIENRKQVLKEREQERERIRKERAAAKEEALKARVEAAAQVAAEAAAQAEAESSSDAAASQTPEEKPAPKRRGRRRVKASANELTTAGTTDAAAGQNETSTAAVSAVPDQQTAEAAVPQTPAAEAETVVDKKHQPKKRVLKKRIRKQAEAEQAEEKALKVLSEDTGLESASISEEANEAEDETEEDEKNSAFENAAGEDDVDDDDDDTETDFELQRKLLRARKLFHRHKIQDVIKEGQIVLVQVVKEERGNKGAALTTYLSLAGRYCVLMPNRIKSGGVSRKITNAADRTRLKGIVKELPLTSDMSIIVRTAGEEKTKADIVRDYNYLIRTWNQIRLDSLKGKAPSLIHEEGNLIKRALRDIYSKDTAEILVAGEEAYKSAKDFFKILSPHNLKKIKLYRHNDMPLFQRFQVEGQLDKLHEANAQLESGGYLVINPTEALISIDVNSGRATKEKDLEETALKTNLEACDEIARQLRMRNLAGLVVIDFIDMDDPANNHAVEKRMKEALKKDRSRIQVGKMSMFGLLELSRQRLHSSFFESNYQVCPHCQGKGIIRTIESSAMYILRMIEEEGIKNRSSRINIYIPSEIAIYLLNQKRQMLSELEQKYKMCVVISADDSVKCISDYRIERTKAVKEKDDAPVAETKVRAAEQSRENIEEDAAERENADTPAEPDERRRGRDRRRGRNRFDRRRRFDRKDSFAGDGEPAKEKQEAVILYNSHEDIKSNAQAAPAQAESEPTKEKSAWWKKLIKG